MNRMKVKSKRKLLIALIIILIITILGVGGALAYNIFFAEDPTPPKGVVGVISDGWDTGLKDENAEVLLPHFSCHSLRHTFTTRMCEAGVNVKVIQDTLGHKDISTTLNIYTDVTKELRKSEFEGLDSYFKK